MPNRFFIIISLFTLVLVASHSPAPAQPGVFSREDIIRFTPLWKGERLPDGRPRVSDDILARMKKVSMEEAWGVLQRHGFINQFEMDWEKTHDNPVLVGRALTAVFMPARPDFNDVIAAEGKRDGRIGAQNSWVIDTLQKGDVLVVDLFGKVAWGTFAGDNLANSIKAKSGTGFVIDGGCRDIEGILEVPDCPVFVRGWHPSFIRDVMLMGINVPVRIGQTTVVPGDIVLGKREGVLFIPAHLAEEVVENSEIISLQDEFGHQRLREGKFTPGQIDAKWTPEIEKDFANWLKTDKGDEITPAQREKILKGRK
ncbi:MAG: RraA family protein [Candidatus Latescibacterota bacterium]